MFAVACIYSAVLSICNTSTINVPTTLPASPNTIDWGTLTPNQTAQRIVTLTNTGTAQTTQLIMTHNSTVGVVTWNQQGNIIPAEQTLTCTFTLTVSPNPPQGAFNFDITITG